MSSMIAMPSLMRAPNDESALNSTAVRRSAYFHLMLSASLRRVKPSAPRRLTWRGGRWRSSRRTLRHPPSHTWHLYGHDAPRPRHLLGFSDGELSLDSGHIVEVFPTWRREAQR